MQQHSNRPNAERLAPNAEVDALLAGLERILLRLADVGPRDRVTVPVVLPLEVAELMVAHAEAEGLDLEELYTSCLLHGLFAVAPVRFVAGPPAAGEGV